MHNAINLVMTLCIELVLLTQLLLAEFLLQELETQHLSFGHHSQPLHNHLSLESWEPIKEIHGH